jgi:hypothetical protein
MNRHRTLRRTAFGALALAFVAGVYAAGEPPQSVSGTATPSVPGAALPKGHYAALDRLPDWGGIWTIEFPRPGMKREMPQLKGKYLADYQAFQKDTTAHHGMVRKKKANNCTPPGMPYIMSVAQYPIEFLFTPGRVTIHHEAWMQWRVIFTDGRPHPDTEPTFNGNSIGHWEGDTLVVDTVNIKPTVPLMPGMYHSDKVHILEHFALDKANPDTMHVQITVEDPEALVKPYTNTLTFMRSRDADLLEFICAENDRNPVDASGETTFEN